MQKPAKANHMCDNHNQEKAELTRKVLFVSPHPAPYRDPLLYEIGKRGLCDLYVYNIAPSDLGHREWDYRSLPYRVIGCGARSLLQVVILVLRSKFDLIIVPGIYKPSSLLLVMLAIAFNVRYLLAIDSVEEGKLARKISLVRGLTRFVRARAFGFFVPGLASSRYLLSCGICGNQVFTGLYVFDWSKYDTRWINVDVASRKKIVIVTLGNFTKCRNYILLVDAFRLVRQEFRCRWEICLELIGGGPEKARVHQYINREELNYIKIRDPIPFSAISREFARAHIFAHPGSEPFSTATELAAASGLLIVANPGVGYIHDLKANGGVVYEFEANSSLSLSSALGRAIKCASGGQEFESQRKTNREAAIKRSMEAALDQFRAMVYRKDPENVNIN